MRVSEPFQSQSYRTRPLSGDPEIGDLPSEIRAKRLLRGEPGALLEVIGSTLERAIIIAVPLAMLKIELWKVLVGALSSSTLITLFVISYTKSKEDAAKTAAEKSQGT